MIRPLVLNKTLVDFVFTDSGRYSDDSPAGFEEFYNDSVKGYTVTITDVKTKGKFMWWEFSNKWYMFVTYGMTGQFSPKRGKHPAYYLQYTTPPSMIVENIYYNDPRHFGTVKFTNSVVDLTEKIVNLGWDPFTGFDYNNKTFIQYKLKSSNKPIAQLLMDQSIFAGVGNYIKSEALYLAKLSPHRTGNSLSNDEIYELCQSIMSVMQTSYQHQGATLSTFKTPYGDEGKYSTLFKVYGCKADPLGNKIIKETLDDKRTTHWVPQVQR